jgi:hypothetical protein
MLTQRQLEYLSDFERFHSEPKFHGEFGRKWGPSNEIYNEIYEEWLLDPEFNERFFEIKNRNKPPVESLKDPETVKRNFLEAMYGRKLTEEEWEKCQKWKLGDPPPVSS